MNLLLHQREAHITVTVICKYFNLEIVRLLLDQQGGQVQITEDVIKAARHNQNMEKIRWGSY
jgi:hypothetical protein